MTLALILVNAALGAGCLIARGLAGPVQRRWLRATATIGIVTGVVAVVARGSLIEWRSITLEPGPAAIAGAAVACSWGLTIALEIDQDRWWIAGLNGFGAAALLSFAGAAWVVPALMFWGCLSAALTVAVARDYGRAWAWLALGDAAIAAALIAAAATTQSWRFPTDLQPELVVTLAAAVVLRTGIVAGAGTFDVLGSRSGALTPLTVGSGFILTMRVLDRPIPIAAAALLVIASAAVLPALVRGSFRIRALASWSPAVGLGLCVAAPAVATTASFAAVVGVTAFAAWPEALDRGRLSRAAVVSMIMPNVVFGAVATVATDAFVNATTSEGWVERAPWTAVASLLPLILAIGLALGVAVARTQRKGTYLPEAVFMTWVLFAVSIAAAAFLGAGGVYAALGGPPAGVLILIAVVAGALAAWRASGRGSPPEPLVDVEVGTAPILPHAARVAAGAVQVVAAAAVAWFTVTGLQTGFL